MESKTDYDDCCSDDDIFLSPDKRINRKLSNIQESAVPVQGIYEERIKRLKSCLNGIPRPPAEPFNVYFSMEDVESFVTSSKSQNLVSTTDKAHVRNPLGVYLNLDHSCEEIERLGALYIEKYLPHETFSSVNNLGAYIALTASAKKRRRCNGWATSPGSRLSYLARRKSTFSVNQVSKLGQPASSKQFLMQRDQSIKGIRSVPSKPKRALFQSPEEEKKQNPFRTPDVDKKRRVMRRLSMPSPRTSRSVTPQQSPIKGVRKPRSCKKSLEFKEVLEKNEQCRKQDMADKHVKRKLLWAVSTALKGVLVTSSHSKFKMCMNKLFKASLLKWNENHHERKSKENSTSEAMLAVAKSLLDTVIIPELGQEKIKNSGDEIQSQETDTLKKIDGNTLKDTESQNVLTTPKYSEMNSKFYTTENSNISIQIPKILVQESVPPLKESILPTPNTSFMCTSSSLRVCEPKELLLCRNSEEFRCSNHKRKREELEDEDELLVGITSLDCYHISKSAKTDMNNFRTVINKLTSSGT